MICTRTWRCVCLALICCVCAPLTRTRTYPAGEFHLGFTEFNNEYGTDRHNSPCLVFNFGYNVARNLRLVADFGSRK